MKDSAPYWIAKRGKNKGKPIPFMRNPVNPGTIFDRVPITVERARVSANFTVSLRILAEGVNDDPGLTYTEGKQWIAELILDGKRMLDPFCSATIYVYEADLVRGRRRPWTAESAQPMDVLYNGTFVNRFKSLKSS
jgi:hypothetical protein